MNNRRSSSYDAFLAEVENEHAQYIGRESNKKNRNRKLTLPKKKNAGQPQHLHSMATASKFTKFRREIQRNELLALDAMYPDTVMIVQTGFLFEENDQNISHVSVLSKSHKPSAGHSVGNKSVWELKDTRHLSDDLLACASVVKVNDLSVAVDAFCGCTTILLSHPSVFDCESGRASAESRSDSTAKNTSHGNTVGRSGLKLKTANSNDRDKNSHFDPFGEYLSLLRYDPEFASLLRFRIHLHDPPYAVCESRVSDSLADSSADVSNHNDAEGCSALLSVLIDVVNPFEYPPLPPVVLIQFSSILDSENLLPSLIDDIANLLMESQPLFLERIVPLCQLIEDRLPWIKQKLISDPIPPLIKKKKSVSPSAESSASSSVFENQTATKSGSTKSQFTLTEFPEDRANEARRLMQSNVMRKLHRCAFDPRESLPEEETTEEEDEDDNDDDIIASEEDKKHFMSQKLPHRKRSLSKLTQPGDHQEAVRKFEKSESLCSSSDGEFEAEASSGLPVKRKKCNFRKHDGSSYNDAENNNYKKHSGSFPDNSSVSDKCRGSKFSHDETSTDDDEHAQTWNVRSLNLGTPFDYHRSLYFETAASCPKTVSDSQGANGLIPKHIIEQKRKKKKINPKGRASQSPTSNQFTTKLNVVIDALVGKSPLNIKSDKSMVFRDSILCPHLPERIHEFSYRHSGTRVSRLLSEFRDLTFTDLFSVYPKPIAAHSGQRQKLPDDEFNESSNNNDVDNSNNNDRINYNYSSANWKTCSLRISAVHSVDRIMYVVRVIRVESLIKNLMDQLILFQTKSVNPSTPKHLSATVARKVLADVQSYFHVLHPYLGRLASGWVDNLPVRLFAPYDRSMGDRTETHNELSSLVRTDSNLSSPPYHSDDDSEQSESFSISEVCLCFQFEHIDNSKTVKSTLAKQHNYKSGHANNKGLITAEFAFTALRQISESISFLHSRSLAHWNVTLENITWQQDDMGPRFKLREYGFLNLVVNHISSAVVAYASRYHKQSADLARDAVAQAAFCILTPESERHFLPPEMISLASSGDRDALKCGQREKLTLDIYAIGVLIMELFSQPVQPGSPEVRQKLIAEVLNQRSVVGFPFSKVISDKHVSVLSECLINFPNHSFLDCLLSDFLHPVVERDNLIQFLNRVSLPTSSEAIHMVNALFKRSSHLPSKESFFHTSAAMPTSESVTFDNLKTLTKSSHNNNYSHPNGNASGIHQDKMKRQGEDHILFHDQDIFDAVKTSGHENGTAVSLDSALDSAALFSHLLARCTFSYFANEADIFTRLQTIYSDVLTEHLIHDVFRNHGASLIDYAVFRPISGPMAAGINLSLSEFQELRQPDAINTLFFLGFAPQNNTVTLIARGNRLLALRLSLFESASLQLALHTASSLNTVAPALADFLSMSMRHNPPGSDRFFPLALTSGQTPASGLPSKRWKSFQKFYCIGPAFRTSPEYGYPLQSLRCLYAAVLRLDDIDASYLETLSCEELAVHMAIDFSSELFCLAKEVVRPFTCRIGKIVVVLTLPGLIKCALMEVFKLNEKFSSAFAKDIQKYHGWQQATNTNGQSFSSAGNGTSNQSNGLSFMQLKAIWESHQHLLVENMKNGRYGTKMEINDNDKIAGQHVQGVKKGGGLRTFSIRNVIRRRSTTPMLEEDPEGIFTPKNNLSRTHINNNNVNNNNINNNSRENMSEEKSLSMKTTEMNALRLCHQINKLGICKLSDVVQFIDEIIIPLTKKTTTPKKDDINNININNNNNHHSSNNNSNINNSIKNGSQSALSLWISRIRTLQDCLAACNLEEFVVFDFNLHVPESFFANDFFFILRAVRYPRLPPLGCGGNFLVGISRLHDIISRSSTLGTLALKQSTRQKISDSGATNRNIILAAYGFEICLELMAKLLYFEDLTANTNCTDKDVKQDSRDKKMRTSNTISQDKEVVSCLHSRPLLQLRSPWVLVVVSASKNVSAAARLCWQLQSLGIPSDVRWRPTVDVSQLKEKLEKKISGVLFLVSVKSATVSQFRKSHPNTSDNLLPNSNNATLHDPSSAVCQTGLSGQLSDVAGEPLLYKVHCLVDQLSNAFRFQHLGNLGSNSVVPLSANSKGDRQVKITSGHQAGSAGQLGNNASAIHHSAATVQSSIASSGALQQSASDFKVFERESQVVSHLLCGIARLKNRVKSIVSRNCANKFHVT